MDEYWEEKSRRGEKEGVIGYVEGEKRERERKKDHDERTGNHELCRGKKTDENNIKKKKRKENELLIT